MFIDAYLLLYLLLQRSIRSSTDSGFNIRTIVEDDFKLLFIPVLFVFSCKGNNKIASLNILEI